MALAGRAVWLSSDRDVGPHGDFAKLAEQVRLVWAVGNDPVEHFGIFLRGVAARRHVRNLHVIRLEVFKGRLMHFRILLLVSLPVVRAFLLGEGAIARWVLGLLSNAWLVAQAYGVQELADQT